MKQNVSPVTPRTLFERQDLHKEQTVNVNRNEKKKSRNISGQRGEDSTSMYPSKLYSIFSYLHCDHQQRYVNFLEMASAIKCLSYEIIKKTPTNKTQNIQCLVKCFHMFYLFTYIFNERNTANIL